MKNSSGFSNRYSRSTPAPSTSGDVVAITPPTSPPPTTPTLAPTSAATTATEHRPTRWGNRVRPASTEISLLRDGVHPWTSEKKLASTGSRNSFAPSSSPSAQPLPPSHPPPHPYQSQHPPSSIPPHPHQPFLHGPPLPLEPPPRTNSANPTPSSTPQDSALSHPYHYQQQQQYEQRLQQQYEQQQEYEQQQKLKQQQSHSPISETRRLRIEARSEREQEWDEEAENMFQDSLVELQDPELLIKQKEVHKRRAKGESWICVHEIDLPFEREEMTRIPSYNNAQQHKHSSSNKEDRFKERTFDSFTSEARSSSRDPRLDPQSSPLDYFLRLRSKIKHVFGKCEYAGCSGDETTCEGWGDDTLSPIKLYAEAISYDEHKPLRPSSPNKTHRSSSSSGGSSGSSSSSHRSHSRESHSSSFARSSGSWSPPPSPHTGHSHDSREDRNKEDWRFSPSNGWVKTRSSSSSSSSRWVDEGWARSTWEGEGWVGEGGSWSGREGRRNEGGRGGHHNADNSNHHDRRSSSSSSSGSNQYSSRGEKRGIDETRVQQRHSPTRRSYNDRDDRGRRGNSPSRDIDRDKHNNNYDSEHNNSEVKPEPAGPSMEEKVIEIENFIKEKLIDAAKRRIRSRLETVLFNYVNAYKPPTTTKNPLLPHSAPVMPPPAPSRDVASKSKKQKHTNGQEKQPLTREEKAAKKEAKRLRRERRQQAKLLAEEGEGHEENNELEEGEEREEGEQVEEEQVEEGEHEQGEIEEGAREEGEEQAGGEIHDEQIGGEEGARIAEEEGEGEVREEEEGAAEAIPKERDGDEEIVQEAETGEGEGEEKTEDETRPTEAEGVVEATNETIEDEEEEGEEEGDVELAPNPSGCARCEPWDEAKPRLWEWRRRRARLEESAAVAAARANENPLGQGVQQWGPSVFLGGGIPDESVLSGTSSRAARNSKRKLQATQLAYIQDDANTNLVNQLQRRHKSIRIFNSAIHDCGVFAEVPIEPGEVVVEYLGELVRQIVADRREEMYMKQGIDSSYMFRLDKNLIIDATKKGGLARFLNHSCDPNCYTREIMHSNTERIVIYSRKKIAKGEELTYDYKFPLEDVKIPCRCGAKTCRGSLN